MSHIIFLPTSLFITIINLQPPRLSERNGKIVGYYIRYGRLGTEMLSKMTIRWIAIFNTLCLTSISLSTSEMWTRSKLSLGVWHPSPSMKFLSTPSTRLVLDQLLPKLLYQLLKEVSKFRSMRIINISVLSSRCCSRVCSVWSNISWQCISVMEASTSGTELWNSSRISCHL